MRRNVFIDGQKNQLSNTKSQYGLVCFLSNTTTRLAVVTTNNSPRCYICKNYQTIVFCFFYCIAVVEGEGENDRKYEEWTMKSYYCIIAQRIRIHAS